MSEKETQDLYEGNNPDSPLIDSLGSAVKNLIEKGKERGYITMEELNKVLPPEKESSEQIEDIMSGISDLGISIISESETDTFESDEDEEEQDEDYAGESGNFDEKEMGRSDDPVRMYLKEMGTVELLSREGEIAIAKRIEAGKTVMISGLCESPMTLKAIAGWRDDLVNGTMQLRDIIDLEMMYGDDSEAMVYDEEETQVDDLEKVAKELTEKNLDDIDDDLDPDIELEDTVDEVEDIADDEDIAAQVEPQQHDDDGGQGPVHQGVPGGQVDEPGEQDGGHRQGHRRHKSPGEDGGLRFAPGSGHPVYQQHKEEDQQEEEQKAHPLPVPGQSSGVQPEQMLRRPEEPAAGEEHHQGQTDGHQQQQGKEDAGDHLPQSPVALPPVDLLHDVHQGPEGRRGKEHRHENPGDQQCC